MFGSFGVEFIVIGLLNALFWGGLIILIFFGIRWLIRQQQADRPARGPDDTALELLRQRYARGEIDATEFEERKRTLGV